MNMIDEKKLADWVSGNPYAAANKIERLEAALKPFADTLNHISGMNYRDDAPLSSEWVGAGKLTVGDLRRAHQSLKD